MAGGIIRAAVATHSPRMGIEEKAPDFVRPLIAGLREMGDAIRAAKPDVIVVHSTHWVCTFMWYVTTQAIHKGICVGDEIPDFIPGSPYQYKGDPEFARAVSAYTRPGPSACTNCRREPKLRIRSSTCFHSAG